MVHLQLQTVTFAKSFVFLPECSSASFICVRAGELTSKKSQENWNSKGKSESSQRCCGSGQENCISHQTRSWELHRSETELRENPALPTSPCPRQKGLSLTPVVQWESTPHALWKENGNYILLCNVLSEQLQKQTEKFLEQQQHGKRIPASVACV